MAIEMQFLRDLLLEETYHKKFSRNKISEPWQR